MIKIHGKFSKNILRMKDREFYIFYQEGESSYDDIIKVNTIMKTEGLIPEEYLVLMQHYYVLATNFSIQMVIYIWLMIYIMISFKKLRSIRYVRRI